MAEQVRTQFALAAMDMASTFNTAFADKTFAGFKLKMTAPEGQSTGGGKLAVEHVVLQHESDGTKAVMATVAHAQRAVELRAYEHVAKAFETRFQGRAFGLARNIYEDAQKKVAEFFTTQVFQVTQAAAPKLPAPLPQAKGGSLMWLWIVLALAVVGGGAFAGWWFLMRNAGG
ncbi:MAG TPA: hypothetical protein PK668_09660 [Myxococcota bacterium]|nr:hypothetical protein [Myxococcota bacterium]HRY92751.1 hypothetical protein [Myxococcota bacterium]HSA21459.1 hypothetical protein [Myxococcota bacterium]